MNILLELKEKNKNGITLIALVITIIVLLVLAGVSINLLLGENGVVTKAQISKGATEKAGLKEEVQLALLNRETERIVSDSNAKSFKEELESGIPDAIVERVNATDDYAGLADVYYILKGNQYVTVYDDGEVIEGKAEIWDGKTISCPEFKKENDIWNWYIYTPSQLKFLADFVNNGNALTSEQAALIENEKKYNPSDIKIITENITETNVTKIFLMNDLDFGGRIGENGATDELRWENNIQNNNVAWTPIGNQDIQLMANFYGNNHTIRGIYVKQEGYSVGLFGKSSLINDVKIKNSYIKGSRGVGGISGNVYSGGMNNCHNINTLVIGTEMYTGGVVGVSNYAINNCSNSGKIISKGNNAGGIVGYSDVLIQNCNNSGPITGETKVTGGIVGSSRGTIRNCKNTANVTGINDFVGGIAGVAFYVEWDNDNPAANNTNQEIIECINLGNITGNYQHVGGIVGLSGYPIKNCINNGQVKAIDECVGGIVGFAEGIVTNCSNKGLVTGVKDCVGGIAGISNYSISNCVNTGNVSGEANNVAGIITHIKPGSSITECRNSGEITGKGQYTGGILAAVTHINNESNLTIEKCYNNGKINGTKDTAGIIGSLGGSAGKGTIVKCYNSGRITGTENVGELVGSVINQTGKNTFNNLFYLENDRGLTAIANKNNDINKKIMSVNVNLNYEQFKTWIEEQ